jgi:hypothetical protein
VGGDQPGQVVGARVGVLHRVSSTLQAPGADPARPAAVSGGRFCVMQPFFEQRQPKALTAETTDAESGDPGGAPLA